MTQLKTLTAALALALAAAASLVHAAPVEVFSEGFNDIMHLPGWVQVNNSSPQGNGWFQGNTAIFGAQAGPNGSCIAANYLSAQFGSGMVDSWLITPVINLYGASTFSFFTRGAGDPGFADTLQVYFSPGTGADVGAFADRLATVGTGGYPDAWTQVSTDFTFTGAGRFAFHYAGDADNLDYIGIDSVRVLSAVPEPSSALMLGLGLGAVGLLRRRARK